MEMKKIEHHERFRVEGGDLDRVHCKTENKVFALGTDDLECPDCNQPLTPPAPEHPEHKVTESSIGELRYSCGPGRGRTVYTKHEIIDKKCVYCNADLDFSDVMPQPDLGTYVSKHDPRYKVGDSVNTIIYDDVCCTFRVKAVGKDRYFTICRVSLKESWWTIDSFEQAAAAFAERFGKGAQK